MPRQETSHRYVVLHHTEVDTPHFDLMIEREPGGPLITWRVSAWPIVHPTRVERLTDHRRDYLEYEGPVSSNRGHVRRVESGVCRITGRDAWTIRFPDNRTLKITGPASNTVAQWTSTTPASSPAS